MVAWISKILTNKQSCQTRLTTCFLFLCVSSFAYSQSSLRNDLSSEKSSEKKLWNGFFNSEYSESFVDDDDILNQKSWVNVAQLSYRLNEKDKISVLLGYEQEIGGKEETQFFNTRLRLSHFLNSFENSSQLASRFSIYLPTNPDARTYLSYRGAMDAGLVYLHSFDVLNGLLLSASETFRYSFFEFKDTRAGSLNSDKLLTHFLSLSLVFVPKWTLTFDQSISSSWRTDNVRNKDSLRFEQYLSYSGWESLVLTAGHRLADSLYDYDGSSMNLKVFDQAKSQLYVSGLYLF